MRKSTNMKATDVKPIINSVRCYTCGAKKGEYCTTKSNGVMHMYVHKRRKQDAGDKALGQIKGKVASPQMEMKFDHPAYKPLEYLTFPQLVDRAALDIHMSLLDGQYRQAIHRVLGQAIRWSKAQEDK